jgi:DNA helicase II / ATP-dependent DNA helicase PcrA
VTSRIGSPDTDADLQLRECLDQQPTRSFLMVAGAGSGKTTSLVKALAHLEKTKGTTMRRRGQQIACITYTEVAVGEIWGDVGNASLIHVSTIHSFLWTVVHSFQTDLHAWVVSRINEKIADAEVKLANSRTQARTRVRLTEEIEWHRYQLTQLAGVSRFKYGTASNYAKGLLGHDDILKVGPALIVGHALLRSLIAQRFPYIFVDESQDTNPTLVEALKQIAAMPGTGFCLGFFGDPMQQIYTAGAGPIIVGDGWNAITKPENFRCPTSVLSAINRIRAEGDRLVQTPGKRIGQDGAEETAEGTARLFVVPTGANRSACLEQVRRWLANANADPLWKSDEKDGNVRLLVLVHRIAARRLGFPELYAALNDNGATSLKDGLLEGTAWVLRPFLTYLLPLVLAARAGEDFIVIAALRKDCPLLSKERLAGQDVAALLARLKADVDVLIGMLKDGSARSIRDLLMFVRDREIATLDERFIPFLTDGERQEPADGEDSEYASVVAFLATPAIQLWGYRSYIESQSPFSTQQGIKGAEFQRVLVVLDDEESEYNLFSYGKYLGIEALSDRDNENIAAGTDSVLDRTRRLFYVCCSRAVRDLAVVLFAPNVRTAHDAVLAKGIFAPDDVHVLEDAP